MKAKPAEERFWNKVDKQGPKDCWNWTAARYKNGYGAFQTGGRKGPQVGAHCFSLSLKLGRPLKPGEWALHNCDNPSCVNPVHLFLGNAKINTQDMLKKNRGRNGTARLKKEDIVGIRIRYNRGELMRTIAKEFGVCPETISHAVRGNTWKQAEGPIQKIKDMRSVRSGHFYPIEL